MMILAAVPVRQVFASVIVLLFLQAVALPVVAETPSGDAAVSTSQHSTLQSAPQSTGQPTGQATAETAPANIRPEPVVSGSSIVQVVLSLIFVVVLIYAVAWYLRKMQFSAAMPGQRMQVVSALSVGARERVVLVQVGEEQVLLGVAPGRVNLLHRYSEPVIAATDSDGSPFAKVLGSKLRGGADGQPGGAS